MFVAIGGCVRVEHSVHPNQTPWNVRYQPEKEKKSEANHENGSTDTDKNEGNGQIYLFNSKQKKIENMISKYGVHALREKSDSNDIRSL